jgi:release factor glutamine methyltransferase
MTIGEWLKTGQLKLSEVGVANPRLDLLLMLELGLQKQRTSILANLDEELNEAQENYLEKMLAQRILRKPMAYILGNKEFYGRSFFVNESVLIPRPESESFLELLQKIKQAPASIIDIGTGSGCLAISAKLELPDAKVYATDVSENALKIAKKNANQLGAKINFFQVDLLPNKPEKFDIVFANLPYVPTNIELAKELSYEPKEALFAGKDGLQLINRLISILPKRLARGGLLFCESLEIQHQQIASVAKLNNLDLLTSSGLVQVYGLRD